MSTAEKELAETWEATAERHQADAYRYQALLFHAWASLRSQQKGLKRQAQRIKRLRARLAVLEAAGKEQLQSAETRMRWLVWSHEHGAYLPASRCGYVPLRNAGSFTLTEALEILRAANLGMRAGCPEETMMPDYRAPTDDREFR